jgi:hypothetical protein
MGDQNPQLASSPEVHSSIGTQAAALHETGQHIARHSRARYDCTDRQIQTDKRSACCRDEDEGKHGGVHRPETFHGTWQLRD